MNRSDIFEKFVKIAQKGGLLAEAEHAEHTEKDFPETNPRMDSLSIEQIGKLYNVKPPSPKDMEYKRNIIERAHPVPVVLSPAHDNLNGLVENENEGQNIRARIVMKTPDGHLVQRKYAEQQLILSLVRTANDLDNRNQDELRELADACLMQVSNHPLQKQAFLPIIAGIAAVIGAIYAKQHLRFHSDGFEADYQKAVSEIDDLLNSSTHWGIEGYSYNPAFLQIVNQLKSVLNKLHVAVQQAVPVLERLETPRTGQELKELSQQPAAQEAVAALQNLQNVAYEVYPYIDKVITNFGNETFKQRAIAHKGILSSLVDATEVLHGGAGLISDDFDDVRHALETLKVDVDNLVKGLQASESIQENASQQLQSAETEVSKTFQAPEEQPEGAVDTTDKDMEDFLGR